jgi:hypothetical protein
LADHRADASLHISGEDLLCKVFKAGLEACELDRWTTTAASPAALRRTSAALLLMVGMVAPAPLLSRDSFYLASLAIRLYRGTSSQ